MFCLASKAVLFYISYKAIHYRHAAKINVSTLDILAQKRYSSILIKLWRTRLKVQVSFHIDSVHERNLTCRNPHRHHQGLIFWQILFSGCSQALTIRQPIALNSASSTKRLLVTMNGRLQADHNECHLLLLHVDPLLGNDREISKYTTAGT
jgi:hypothetical protein